MRIGCCDRRDAILFCTEPYCSAGSRMIFRVSALSLELGLKARLTAETDIFSFSARV